MILLVSSHTYWAISLGIGLIAALVVAFLLIVLVRTVTSIEKSVDGLLVVATAVAGNTAYIPQLQATAPVLGEIIDEAIVQDGYMNAADRRLRGGREMSQNLLIVLSVLLAVVVVAVLAAALIVVRRSLERTSAGLATLASALQGVESEHLRGARGLGEGDQRAVRDHPRRPAGHRPQGIDRRGEEAEVTLWWIADALLVLVVLPVVIYLLHGVLSAARSIVPSVNEITRVSAAASKDLDAVPLLLTTKEQVSQTVAGVANYGGSLDVIIDDA